MRTVAWLAAVTFALSGGAGAQPLVKTPPVAPPVAQPAAFDYEAWLAKHQATIAKRTALVNATLANVAAEMHHGGGGTIEDRVALHAKLHGLPMHLLESAPDLRTLADVQSLARGKLVALPTAFREKLAQKALGDLTQDLIFIPHGPCRIVDTRNAAAGAIAGGTARAFVNFSTSSQGVTSPLCNDGGGGGVGYFAGSGGAIAITVTGIAPGAPGSLYGPNGFLAARPVGSTNVTATVLILSGQPYTASNSAVIRTSTGVSDFEIFAPNGSPSHVVVDLLGFYAPPAPTALDCVDTAATNFAVPAGTYNSGTSPSCPVGYTVVSGNCSTDSFPQLTDSHRSSNAWTCGWTDGGSSATAAVSARCCRTPGNASGRF